MERRFVTCFRDVATHVIVMSRTLHSLNQNVLCGSELVVDHKTQTNVRFESVTIIFDDVIVLFFYHKVPAVLESQAYIYYFLNC